MDPDKIRETNFIDIILISIVIHIYIYFLKFSPFFYYFVDLLLLLTLWGIS
jgi:hypothetical protein